MMACALSFETPNLALHSLTACWSVVLREKHLMLPGAITLVADTIVRFVKRELAQKREGSVIVAGGEIESEFQIDYV